MDYRSTCEYLFRLPRFDTEGISAIKPGLANIRGLLADLGDPHRSYPTIHVAGTNGKGSVSSMLASIMTSAGMKTGLHTSPHLFSLTERFRVDGVEAEPSWLVSAVERMQPAIDRVRPSFFEATTALALLYFADQTVDIAVVEVGMGGRLDATNVITPELAVITNIGLDHTSSLGSTIAEIAREKGGIIKQGIPTVIGACQPEVVGVLSEIAERQGSVLTNVCRHPWKVESDGTDVRLITPRGILSPFRLDLAGRHQQQNALVATAAAMTLEALEGIDERAIVRGLSNTRRLSGLRARCEIVTRNPTVMVDVAHNEDGIRSAIECLELEAPATENTKTWVMLGLAADKDVKSILSVLSTMRCTVMPVTIPGNRGLAPKELARQAKIAGLRIVEIENAKDGYTYFQELALPGDRLMILGSHYLVGTLPVEIFPR